MRNRKGKGEFCKSRRQFLIWKDEVWFSCTAEEISNETFKSVAVILYSGV